MKWITIIPLAGGYPVGAQKDLGTVPEAVISWPAFKANDSHYQNYLRTEYNYPEENFVLLDEENNVTQGSTNYLSKDIDIVISTPPCAGLSMLNTGNSKDSDSGRGACAAQNEWMKRASEYALDVIKPKVLIFENAPGLYTSKDGEEVMDYLNSVAEKFGYSTSAIMTSTDLHGIPQIRKRTFFYFWKSETSPLIEFSSTDEVAPSIKEYLSKKPPFKQDNIYPKEGLQNDPFFQFVKTNYDDFRSDMNESRKRTMTHHIIKSGKFDEFHDYILENHSGTPAAKFVQHAKKKLADNKNFFDPSPNYFGDDRLNGIVGKTVTHTVHPIEDRFLSYGELLYFMGYPNTFELLEPKKNTNHIAQNVPVTTGAWSVKQARLFIEGKLQETDKKFVKQNNIKKTTDTLVATQMEEW